MLRGDAAVHAVAQPTSGTEEPTACGEFDVVSGAMVVHTRDVRYCTATRLLIRRDSVPLGYLYLEANPAALTADGVGRAAEQKFGGRPSPVMTRDLAPYAPHRSGVRADLTVTVAICTRNRPDALGRCLRSLRDVTYPGLEVLVVDNAPSDDATERLVAAAAADDSRLVYLREPEPGLSHARNAALAHAQGEIIAFSDDDTTFSADWVVRLADAFGVSVATRCVTGLVTSLQLVTPYDRYFESRYPYWWTRMDAHVYQGIMPAEGPLYPFAAGRFGTGANFAVHRATALRLGGFDAALGAGTHAMGGEDLDMFVRVLRAGHELRYEPRAVVWHAHRRALRGQLSQPFHYGTGCAAYITKLMCDRSTRWDVARRAPRGARHVMSSLWSVGVEKSATGRQWLALPLELLGYVYGPIAYLLARRAARTARGTHLGHAGQ